MMMKKWQQQNAMTHTKKFILLVFKTKKKISILSSEYVQVHTCIIGNKQKHFTHAKNK